MYLIRPRAKSTRPILTGRESTIQPTDNVKVAAMAITAMVFSLGLKPTPARRSRMIGPNTRWLTSHRSNRSDDREKKKPASNTGPVVGINGMTMPTIAIPNQSTPRVAYTIRTRRERARVVLVGTIESITVA